MNLTIYYGLISSEVKAKKYLLAKCFKNHQRFCPRCNSRTLYKLSDERYRCSRCEYTFHDFSGRWINEGRLTFVQWLSLIKLFELEISVQKMSQQMGLSYRAVYKAVRTIRLSILSHAKDAERLLGGGTNGSRPDGRNNVEKGRGAAGTVPVFGIMERNGVVQVTVVSDMTAETLLDLPVKKVRRGSVVYTDKFESYDSLMFCGFRHPAVDHKKRFTSGKVYIDGLEGFWSWAKERLIKHNGVSKEHFPLYLKGLEFKYNNRNSDIFDRVAEYLCDMVPKQDQLAKMK
jgi:transposase